jgi:hypothetical protein
MGRRKEGDREGRGMENGWGEMEKRCGEDGEGEW